MRTGDGLLARIRVAGSRLSPHQLEGIANLAGRYGNGQVEITARGNLQIRGLTATSAEPFALAAETIVAIERGLVVETPPLAGNDPREIADPRPLATAIRTAAQTIAHCLGPKVTVIVDGNGQITLAGLKADIRLLAISPHMWSLTVGNVHLSVSSAVAAGAATTALNLVADLGPEARATDLSDLTILAALGELAEDAPPPRPETSAIGTFTLRTGAASGVGLPFGAMQWQSLGALAAGAGEHGVTEFRLAPHRSLLAIGARSSFLAEARSFSLITLPNDPRTRISACIGSDGCSSGFIAARAIALRLGELVTDRTLPATSDLHISGCAKGCAHPRRAGLTLVGRPDGYGLVIDGRAGDTPRTLLRADQIESAIAGPVGQG